MPLEPELRADARRNRARLVDAAAAAFQVHGPSASLDGIARAAGVGSGTLYRHFPTRDDLARAVFRSRVDDVCRQGRALAAHTEPLPALRGWLQLLAELSITDGLTSGLLEGDQQWPAEFAAECHQALRAAGTVVFDRARPELRPDVTLADVHALVHGVVTASTPTAPDQRLTHVTRLIDIVMAGLRAGT